MKSLTTLSSLYTTLSQNPSVTNVALGQQLINDQHRYLIQKYFANERSAQFTTVGNSTQTLTAPLSIGAVSATLSVAWAYPTCTQQITFSNGQTRVGVFTQNATTLTWSGALTSSATTTVAALGVQSYALPATVSKGKDFTVRIGQQKFLPTEVQSLREWDVVNFLPYNSDIANYFFIYNRRLELFPIPATTGNLINVNFKTRVPDLTFIDYSTGNITAATQGNISITGTATSWNTTGKYPLNVDISYYNLMLRIDPPFGDGIWYPIAQFNSDTTLTLGVPIVNAPNITASSTYTIGQFPLLSEDFHDMLVYGALKTYFTSITDNAAKAQNFGGMYKERLTLLEDYAGTKTAISVDLGDAPRPVNPNLFIFGPTSTP